MIEIVYLTTNGFFQRTYNFSPSLKLKDILQASQLYELYPETKDYPLGVFGKKISIASYQLQDFDRIEVYRPLKISPMERRRLKSS